MGWSYSELSIEDLMKLIKNFIDMLILASGYQSTGLLAHWDSGNIQKCFQWALFLEKVSKGLMSSGDNEDSVNELNAALDKLKSNPHFPQGLAHLSCSTLARARDLLLEHLIHTLPLRESQLKAIVNASVEMDLSKLKRINNDSIAIYLEKLMRITSNGMNLSESKGFMEDSHCPSVDTFPSAKRDNWVYGDCSVSVIEQLGRRKFAVSHSSAVEIGLENLWRTLRRSMTHVPGDTANTEVRKQSACLIAAELPVDSVVWSCWRSRSLSYMLDKRTIRLLSGASLICSAPEDQWARIFERLNISGENNYLCETIELLLLGCIADKWSALIEHLMSVSYDSPTISTLYHEVFNLQPGNSFNLFAKEGLVNPKEKSAVRYLEMLLSRRTDQLWELSPVLAAVAIPSWSNLLRSYLHELECQIKGTSTATRRCSCIANGVEHNACEVAERIWCLYIFRINTSLHATSGTTIVT